MLLLLACTPEPGGTLVYVRGDSAPEVWAQALPAGEPAFLAAKAYAAAADPRGQAVLVVYADHGESLGLVPLDGGVPVSLSATAEQVRNPAWSPDGAWIVYESSAASFRDLYRVPRAGGTPERLTSAPHGSFEPAVDTRGRVVYTSGRDGNPEIYLQDGEAVRRLTTDRGEDRRPAWGGDRIAWIATQEGRPRVWTMKDDGTDARPLRGGAGDDQDFAWSPDGTRIAVVTKRGSVDLEVVDLEGRVTSYATDKVEENPAWSPDGRWLAFSSNRDGDPEIYLASGSQLRRLTTRPGPDWLPRWLPTR